MGSKKLKAIVVTATRKQLDVIADVEALKEAMAALAGETANTRRLVADLLSPDDVVVLVIPIDESAPKGRLILPQQQTIRDILVYCVSLNSLIVLSNKKVSACLSL